MSHLWVCTNRVIKALYIAYRGGTLCSRCHWEATLNSRSSIPRRRIGYPPHFSGSALCLLHCVHKENYKPCHDRRCLLFFIYFFFFYPSALCGSTVQHKSTPVPHYAGFFVFGHFWYDFAVWRSYMPVLTLGSWPQDRCNYTDTNSHTWSIKNGKTGL